MTTNPNPGESKMLEEVRKWRKEAYEEDQARTLEERTRHAQEIMEQMGLQLKIAKKARRIAKNQEE